jgi:hypothetical protein
VESPDGKLFVCGSSFSQKRLRSISVAAERVAKRLKLSFEIRTFGEGSLPIYVYYEMENEEPIPIYCNSSSQTSVEDVCAALRSMMFVLSFHPKHQGLRRIRKEIMRFS